MLTPRFVAWMFSVGLMVLGAGVVYGQDYPNKPIRIVTTEPGGSLDVTARLIAPALTSSLGQPVIVENRVAIISIETVAKAPPDGYTLLIAGNPLWLLPLMRNVSYDPVRDFAPITLTSRAPNILVVHPSVPVQSVKELIALAKAKPGELNYAAASIGSSGHIAGELFKAMAGVKIVRINYKGSGPALNGLIGGEAQLMFSSSASVAPHIKSGRLNTLAVTSAQPSALFPGLPTIAATGLPGYELVQMSGILAPAKTPSTLIKRLSQEIARVLKQADVKEKFFNAGAETVGSSPEEFVSTVKSDTLRMGKVIKDAGIKVD